MEFGLFMMPLHPPHRCLRLLKEEVGPKIADLTGE